MPLVCLFRCSQGQVSSPYLAGCLAASCSSSPKTRRVFFALLWLNTHALNAALPLPLIRHSLASFPGSGMTVASGNTLDTSATALCPASSSSKARLISLKYFRRLGSRRAMSRPAAAAPCGREQTAGMLSFHLSSV
ncbi:hypothetical protein D3C85_1091170 [compost metagenome]